MNNPEVEIAVLQTKVEVLTAKVEKLTEAVEGLTAAMNRGKGAFAASMCVAGAIGAFIMKMLGYLHITGK